MKKIRDYEGKKGYSVFENTDKELVEKIKAVKVVEDITKIHDMFQGECDVIEVISDTEVLAKNKDVKHIVLNPDSAKEKLLQAINDQFYVGDYFTKNFGTIAKGGEIILGIEDIMPPNPYRKESYDEVSTASLKTSKIDTSFYEGFEFEYADCYGSVSCFFNENGDYVNRDYNFDIENYESVDPNEYKKKQVDDFIQQVSERVSNELYHIEGTNTWFSKTFAYELNVDSEDDEIYKSFRVYVDAKPKQGSGNAYYHRGCSSDSLKLSKACEKELVSKESFLKILRGELEDNLSLKL